MKKANVYSSLKSLLVKRIILKQENLLKFNQNYNEWLLVKRLPPSRLLVKSIPAISQLTTTAISQTHNNKRNYTKETNTKETIQATPEETKNIIIIMDIFKTINPTINYGNKTTRKSCLELVEKFGLDNAIKMAKYAVHIQGQDYAPTITTPYQLKEKLAQLKIYSDKSNKSKTITV